MPLVDAELRSSAPRTLAFDALYRRAAVLGYVYAQVDPERTTFAVHSRVMGRPPRARTMDPRAAERSNLFVVNVFDGRVVITAVGRDVEEGESLDPTLAQELEIFGESMQRTLSALGGGLLQGGGYGGTPLPREERVAEPEPIPTPAPEPTPAPSDDGAGSSLSAP